MRRLSTRQVTSDEGAHSGSSRAAARSEQQQQHRQLPQLEAASGGASPSHPWQCTQVLREHFNCTLPIEVMWQNSHEMDSQTWSSIEQQFGPIRGVDIGATAHPIPGLHIQYVLGLMRLYH